MLMAQVLALASLAAALVAASPILEERQMSPCNPSCSPGIDCHPWAAPINPDECHGLINTLFRNRGNNQLCTNGRSCRRMTSGSGGCQVGVCNNENYEVCRTGNELAGWANEVTTNCFRSREGGTRHSGNQGPGPFYEVFVTNTRDGPGSPGGPVTPVPPRLNGEVFYVDELSIEQYRAEMKLLEESYANETQIEKREQLQDRFEIRLRTNGPRPGNWRVISPRVIGGTEFQLSEGSDFTVGVSASVGLSTPAFLGMTAEASLSVDISRTETYSRGLNVPVNCPTCGVVEWHPHFTYVEGTFQPSGEFGFFQEPNGGGDFIVTCTGC